MPKPLLLLTIPGLRRRDLSRMPHLAKLCSHSSDLTHSFPSVTWPAQANMLTGRLADQHGVIANGFYWPEKYKVEMWTAWNEVIERPQIWDSLNKHGKTSAAWFPMLSKGCGADYVCMPAPIHKPDGSEDLWCYTKPQEFYGELLESLGHFPLKHFWGPLSNIKSSQWIADSVVAAAAKFKPDFLYIYLPHLDYAAQKDGPDSEAAINALVELDDLIGNLQTQMAGVYGEADWLAVSEYVIKPVDHVSFPNRILREANLLSVSETETGEVIDFENTPAWALVDHQFSHLFIKDNEPEVIRTVTELFQDQDGIESVLANDDRKQYAMNHQRSGDVILVSTQNSWQAYYWWLDDSKAPQFARTVDIHQKPGYDPVELCFDMATKSVPLDATLIKGSHGSPATNKDDGVLLASTASLAGGNALKDTDVYSLVMKYFGCE